MIFKKHNEIKFIPAICPKCGGRLELDSNFEIAYCKDCGAQIIIENAKRKEKTTFDKVISLVERQQEMKRQDNLEQKRLEREEECKIREEDKKKSWWSENGYIILIFGFSIIALIISHFL